MRHENIPYIRYSQPSKRRRSKTTALQDRAIRDTAKRRKGRCRHPKGQTEIRPDLHAADGFLKGRFLPKLFPSNKEVPYPGKAAERSFYKNRDLLCQFYGIIPMETRLYKYPYNIALALWDIQQKLEDSKQEKIDVSVQEGQKGWYLVCDEIYHTGRFLYYIPVLPLYRLLRDRQRKQQGQLLLCVFAYLYHIAGIPYYRDESAYLYWIYDMLMEWMIENSGEWEAEDFHIQIRQCDRAALIGDLMEKKINNNILLEHFESRLKRFVVHTEKDRACYNIARKAFTLYRAYPETTIFEHALWEAQDREEEAALMCKYISFVDDTRSNWLFTNLSQCVNDDLDQCMDVEEPTITRVFNHTLPDQKDDLGFECQIFPMIDDLCKFLNNV